MAGAHIPTRLFLLTFQVIFPKPQIHSTRERQDRVDNHRNGHVHTFASTRVLGITVPKVPPYNCAASVWGKERYLNYCSRYN